MLLQNSEVPWTGRGTMPAHRCCVTMGLGVEALVGDHGGGATSRAPMLVPSASWVVGAGNCATMVGKQWRATRTTPW